MFVAAVMMEASFDEPFELLIQRVRPGRALREHGVDQEHVRALTELNGAWPPILVWGPDNVVVDGAHRVAAARQLGLRTILAIRFVGTSDEAFVESIQRNVNHGLPLTLSERISATREVLSRHPQWSDRWISQLCALSAKTVARLRREGAGEGPAGPAQVRARLGRDGRTRPVASEIVRGRIRDALAAHPQGSLREIAAEVGASPETVRRVRKGLLPGAERCDAYPQPAAPVVAAAPMASAFHLHSVSGAAPVKWANDQAFVSTGPGKDFAAWFEESSRADEWCRYLDAIPLSRIYEVADEARRRAAVWYEFAQTLEARVKGCQSLRA